MHVQASRASTSAVVVSFTLVAVVVPLPPSVGGSAVGGGVAADVAKVEAAFKRVMAVSVIVDHGGPGKLLILTCSEL